MRALLGVVLLCTALSAPARTQNKTDDQERVVFDKAFDLIFDCFKDKAMYALQSGANEQEIAKVMMTLCKRHILVGGHTLYMIALVKGKSGEEAEHLAKKSVVEAATAVLKICSDYLKSKSAH